MADDPNTFPKLRQGFAVKGSEFAREQGRKGREVLAEKIAKGEVKPTGGFKKDAETTAVYAKLGAMKRWEKYYAQKALAEQASVAAYRQSDVEGRFAQMAEQAIGVQAGRKGEVQDESKSWGDTAGGYRRLIQATETLSKLAGGMIASGGGGAGGIPGGGAVMNPIIFGALTNVSREELAQTAADIRSGARAPTELPPEVAADARVRAIAEQARDIAVSGAPIPEVALTPGQRRRVEQETGKAKEAPKASRAKEAPKVEGRGRGRPAKSEELKQAETAAEDQAIEEARRKGLLNF